MPSRSILVIHGALGSAAQMRPVAEALAPLAAPTRVQLVELPGHGETSSAGTPFTVQGFADWLRGAVATEPEAPAVFGYSMGGYVALALESAHPGSFAAIVTLGTKYLWTPEEGVKAAKRLDPAVIRAKVLAFAEVLEARHRGAGGWEANMIATAELVRGLGVAPVLDEAALGRVRCAVTVSVGTLDDTMTIGEASLMASHLSGGRQEPLPGSRHAIEQVDPGQLLDLVARAVA